MSDTFKFPLGSRFRRVLDEYRVTGHVVYENGCRSYVVATWPRGREGYDRLELDAHLVETDPQITAVEE